MGIFRYTEELTDAVRRWSGHSAAPNAWSRERPGGIRVMANRFAEKFLSKAHPIMPIVWFGPVIAYGLYRGSRLGVWPTVTLFVGGWLIWTLTEYLLHRFGFHYVGRSPAGKFRTFMIHGYHHEFPDDRLRLVAPPMMSFPLAVMIFPLFYFIFGTDRWAPAFAGMSAGYIAYDWIHFYTHHFRPKTRLGKWLRRHHLYHHYKDGKVNFGISTPLWDIVFGTLKSTKKRTGSSRDHLASALSTKPTLDLKPGD